MGIVHDDACPSEEVSGWLKASREWVRNMVGSNLERTIRVGCFPICFLFFDFSLDISSRRRYCPF